MAVVGMVSRSKVLLLVDLNRVFSLANLIGSGKCHEQQQRLPYRQQSSSSSSVGAPPLETAAASLPSSCNTTTTSVRNNATASSSTKRSVASSGSASTKADEVAINFKHGLPQVTVPLPSRKESCRFILRPISNTVGDFLNMIRHEDKGVDRVAILTSDGVRIASSNTIETLIQEDFKLIINDYEYNVDVIRPPKSILTKDDLDRLSDVRSLVNQLYEALNVEEHQMKKEKELVSRLENLKQNIVPLEKKRQELDAIAHRRTNILTWCGLGLMSVQFGILARLTWWEYSWDIMEPVTYFVTYGTGMIAYAYFVLTKQEFLVEEVRDREHLVILHKRAKKVGLNLNEYNSMKDEIARIEYDLSRLRDPLQLHLPHHQRSEEFDKPISSSSQNQGSSTMNKIQTIFAKVIKFSNKSQKVK